MSNYNEQHATTMLNALMGTDTLKMHDAQVRAEAIESAYYVIKPFMSLEEWTSKVNYQIGLKEQNN